MGYAAVRFSGRRQVELRMIGQPGQLSPHESMRELLPEGEEPKTRCRGPSVAQRARPFRMTTSGVAQGRSSHVSSKQKGPLSRPSYFGNELWKRVVEPR